MRSQEDVEELLEPSLVRSRHVLNDVGSSRCCLFLCIISYSKCEACISWRSGFATDLGYLFRPFSIEVYGRWGNAAEKTLSEVSKSATFTLGMSVSEFLHMWRRRFSTCLQKENSEKLKNLIRRDPVDPNACQKESVRCFGIDFT